MKQQFIRASKARFLLAAISVLMIAATSQSSLGQESEPPSQGEARSENNVATPVFVSTQISVSDTQNLGCDRKAAMSHAERLAAVNKVVIESEDQLERHPESIKAQEVRAKIGTFAAGSMSDDIAFVSLDRW